MEFNRHIPHGLQFDELQQEPDPSALVLGQCGTCFAINRHEPSCTRNDTLKFGTLMEQHLHEARMEDAEREGRPIPTVEYARPVITQATSRWLAAVLCARKLELLREKRHYLKTRGADVTRFANMLTEIERDLVHINELQDALT
jgi:hypothetical protein